MSEVIVMKQGRQTLVMVNGKQVHPRKRRSILAVLRRWWRCRR